MQIHVPQPKQSHIIHHILHPCTLSPHSIHLYRLTFLHPIIVSLPNRYSLSFPLTIKPSLDFLTVNASPHICFTIILYALSKHCPSWTFIVQVSPPYTITLLTVTQALKFLPFSWRHSPLVAIYDEQWTYSKHTWPWILTYHLQPQACLQDSKLVHTTHSNSTFCSNYTCCFCLTTLFWILSFLAAEISLMLITDLSLTLTEPTIM